MKTLNKVENNFANQNFNHALTSESWEVVTDMVDNKEKFNLTENEITSSVQEKLNNSLRVSDNNKSFLIINNKEKLLLSDEQISDISINALKTTLKQWRLTESENIVENKDIFNLTDEDISEVSKEVVEESLFEWNARIALSLQENKELFMLTSSQVKNATLDALEKCLWTDWKFGEARTILSRQDELWITRVLELHRESQRAVNEFFIKATTPDNLQSDIPCIEKVEFKKAA